MKLKTKILLILFSILVVLSVNAKTFDERVDDILTGGETSTKCHSIGALYDYKYSTLLRKAPMRYCPWRAYVAVFDHVFVESHDNMYWIRIDTDLKSLLKDDAIFNRNFAKSFKATGTKRKKVRKIFNYCSKAKYTTGSKSARDVFTKREGDCAAIAAAFYVLCKVKGIPVRYVIGWTAYGCHAWNRVLIDGQWYWVDCTFSLYLQKKQFKGRTIMDYW